MGLPPEFADKTNDDILSYLRLLNSDGTVAWRRVKMLLLGPGEAGKTTLVHRLISGEFSLGQFSTTHGVDMREWHRNDITFSCWDLGGQETYLNTHPLFFTTRSIYVAVFNARSNDEAKLDSYLRHILATCSSQDLPPVLVVGTRGKEVSPPTEHVMQRWRDVYPNIVGYYHIDSSDGTGIIALSDALEALALSLPHVSEKVPRKYKLLETSLQELRSNNSPFSLSQAAFVDLGTKVGLTEEQATLAISLFHDWGVIHQLPVSAGGDIVLRPQALSDVFSCVIHARDPQPILHHATLHKIWPEFDKQLHVQFLALMHECNLAYPLFSSDGTPLDKSLVPALMSDDYGLLSSPDTALHSRFFSDIRSDLIYPTIRIRYKNTPDRFFPMLHCRLHHMVVSNGMWKHCVFLSHCVGSSSSYAVLRDVPGSGLASSYMEILSAGTDMSCASEVMRVMRILRDESFCGMELDEVSIWCEGALLATNEDILLEFEDGCFFLEYHRGGVSAARRKRGVKNARTLVMPLQPLKILFPEFDVTRFVREVDDELVSKREVEESKDDVTFDFKIGSLIDEGDEQPLKVLLPEFDVSSSEKEVDEELGNEEEESKDDVAYDFKDGLLSYDGDKKAGVHADDITIEQCKLSDRLLILQQHYYMFSNSPELMKSDCRSNLVRHLVMYAKEFLSEIRADHRINALWVMAATESESAYYLMALSAVEYDSALIVVPESVIPIHHQHLSDSSYVINGAVSELLVSCLEDLHVELPVIEGYRLKWTGVCCGNILTYSHEMLRIEQSCFEKEYVGNGNSMSYSKHHRVQQRGMPSMEEVMRDMREVMMRVDNTTSRMESQLVSVDARLQEVLRLSHSQVNMLRSLLKGEHNMPQLLFAVKNEEWHVDSMVNVHLRLFCVCPVTLRVASCGNNGEGWKLKVLRSEVAKILPILKVGVVLLQVAAKLGLGLNVRIPLPSLKSCRSLSDLVMQSCITINLLDDNAAESTNDMLTAIERGGEAALPVAALSELQRDYSTIHNLLEKAGAIDASTGKPKNAGLQVTTSSCDGTTAFVHADGLQRFNDKGAAAFLTPIV